jgi:hypothetical protein
MDRLLCPQEILHEYDTCAAEMLTPELPNPAMVCS